MSALSPYRCALAALLIWALVAPAHALAAATPAKKAATPAARAPEKPEAERATYATLTLTRLENRYAQSLARHRPDLAERYGSTPYSVKFVPLDEASIGAHVRSLRLLLAEADTLPASGRADSLRARLRREIAETVPGGALRRDAFLWLDIVDAAARAPFALGTASGCDRTRRGALQLRTVPEALRGATVLMRGAAAPDETALEARLTRLEQLFRLDLPARTEPCKEGRRRAEFVEADSLAAASLAQFRRWLSPGE